MSIVGNLIVNLKLNSAEFTKGLEYAQKSLTNVGKSMDRLGKDMTTYVTVPLMAAGGVAIKFGAEFEDAFAGVRKTVDETATTSFKDLEKGFTDLSKKLPASAAELAKIGEVAGQLGIKADDLLEFTQVVQEMADSTVLGSEQAAMGLAQFIAASGGSAKEARDLGNVIVKLGNNFATNEATILEFAQRLAGSGTAAGASKDQILALSAAMANVGINAEAGGTAMSMLFNELDKQVATGGEKLKIFAKVMGQTVEEFSASFKKDAGQTVADFIVRLGQIQEAGGSVAVVLDALGLDAARMGDTLKRSAIASDDLQRAFKLAKEEIKGGNALAEEARKRYETFTSQLKILRNELVSALFPVFKALRPIILEDIVPAIKVVGGWIMKLADWFQALPSPIQKTIVYFGLIVAAIGPFLVIASKLFFSVKNIISLFQEGYKGWQLFTKGADAAKKATEGAEGAASKMNGTLLTSAARFAGVAAAIYVFSQGLEDAYQSSKDLWSGQKTLGETIRENNQIWDSHKGIIDNIIRLITGPMRNAFESIPNLIYAANEAWLAWKDGGIKGVYDWMEKTGKEIQGVKEKTLEFNIGQIDSAKSVAEAQAIAKDTVLQAKAAVDQAIESAKAKKQADQDVNKALADQKDKLKGVIPDLSEFGGKTDQAAEALKKLKEAALESLDPWAALQKEIGEYKKAGFDANQISILLADKIKAAGDQEKEMAEKAKALGIELKKVPLSDFTKGVVASSQAMEKSITITQILTQEKKKLAEAIKAGTALAQVDVSQMKLNQGTTKGWTDATWDAVESLKAQRKAVEDDIQVIKQMTAAGYSVDQIIRATGVSVDDLAETAEALGIELDRETLRFLWMANQSGNLRKELDEQEKKTQELRDTWKKVMADIQSAVVKGLTDIIWEGDNFAEKFKNIFKELGKSVTEIFLNSLFNPIFNMIGKLFDKLLWGGENGDGGLLGGLFGGLFGGGKGGDGGGAGGIDPGGELGGILTGGGAGGGAAGLGGLLGKLLGGMKAGGQAIWGALAGLGPAGWAALAGAGILTAILKLTKSEWDKGAKEIGRDFGLDISDSAVKAFVTGMAGLSDNSFEPIRKDVLSSSLAVKNLLLPVAQAKGEVDQLIQSFSHLATSWGTFDLSKELKLAIDTGDWEAFDKAYVDIFEHSQALAQVMPDWADKLTVSSQATEEAKEATAGLNEELGKMAPTLEELLAKVEGVLTSTMKVLEDGFKAMTERLDALLAALGAKLTEMETQLNTVLDKAKLADQYALPGGEQVLPITPGLASYQPPEEGPGGNYYELNFSVASPSEDLVKTTKTQVIPLIVKELDLGNGPLASAVVKTYDKKAKGVVLK